MYIRGREQYEAAYCGETEAKLKETVEEMCETKSQSIDPPNSTVRYQQFSDVVLKLNSNNQQHYEIIKVKRSKVRDSP